MVGTDFPWSEIWLYNPSSGGFQVLAYHEEGNIAADYMAHTGSRVITVHYMRNFMPKDVRCILLEERLERSCMRGA